MNLIYGCLELNYSPDVAAFWSGRAALTSAAGPSDTFPLTLSSQIADGVQVRWVHPVSRRPGGGGLCSVSGICMDLHCSCSGDAPQMQDHLNAAAAQGGQLRHDGCVSALLTRIKCLQCAL